MGRSGNPVLTEEQKRRAGKMGKGGRGGVGGSRSGKRGGNGRAGGSGGPQYGMGAGGYRGQEFPAQRYGFFTNETPSQGFRHINSKDEPPGPPRGPSGYSSFVTPSPATDPPRSLLSGSNWVPVGDRRPMPGPGPSQGGSLNELFGKMVWKKMELIKDAVLTDRLQNDIMKMIADAIREQQDKTDREGPAPGDGMLSMKQENARVEGTPPSLMQDRLLPPAYSQNPNYRGYQPYQGPGFF